MGYFETRPAEDFGFQEILYEKGDWVARVTINRPFNYNAYSTSALVELATAFRDAAFDDQVGVIVYTGAGDRAFCTGGDVKEYEALYTTKPRDYWKYMGLFQAYIESIVNAGKPVVARLNGMAVGGGNESQMACDLAVMAEHAWIGQVGTRVGSVAAGGATQWLPILIGDRRAREMLLFNGQIPAHQCLDWGLVNRVVPSVTKDGKFIEGATPEQIRKAQKGEDGHAINLERLDREVDDLTGKLLQQFPECARYTKQQVNYWKDLAWHGTIGHARDWLSTHYTSMEPWEGMRAFVQKRPPAYMEMRERAASGGSSEFVWGPPALTCPDCGAEGIPQHFTFCGACGHSLAGVAAGAGAE
ncbi:MAG: enoyl-CoA hydratase-related protein [Gemmatimonadota bacterium]|nr:enoyl-CoA hydratase-related protein [Gemmatimonadota bacterium]MDH5760535.1 enoyl-CoA hydratase-related protein [Gemmatimonadota bacterium]